jgi:hypothetical protein
VLVAERDDEIRDELIDQLIADAFKAKPRGASPRRGRTCGPVWIASQYHAVGQDGAILR